MPTKVISKVVVPDVVLNAYKPVLSSGWEIGVAGWAVAIWLWVVAGFIANLPFGLKGDIDEAFSNLVPIFVGGSVTLVVVTMLVRFRAPKATALSEALLGSALALFLLLGVASIVLGVIGLFVAFTESGASAIFTSLMEHVAGIVLGLVLIVWSLGEMAALSRSAPPSSGLKGLDKLVPSGVLNRSELSNSWEFVALGWMVAVWVYSVGNFSDGTSADLGVALFVLVVGGPLAVLAITLTARMRGASQGGELGRWCLDAALVLAVALGVLIIVFGVIDFFKAFTYSGVDTVVAALIGAVAGIVLGALTIIWSLGEIAMVRDLVPGQTFAVPGAVPGTSTMAPPPPPAPASPAPAPAPPPVTAPTTESFPVVPPPPSPPAES